MSLISPGVSVTVDDQSFYVPAAAPTVPLFFIATADEKATVPGGTVAASGTYEHDVVRMVTSITQSMSLYGVPRVLEDAEGNPFHGDARNEYGLFAVNKFLEVANLAYVIRANVNLNDDPASIRAMWSRKIVEAGSLVESLTEQRIAAFNTANGYFPGHPSEKKTVTQSELLSDLTSALNSLVFNTYSFAGTSIVSGIAVESDFKKGFMNNHTATPLDVFSNGYNAPTTGTYLGIQGNIAAWIAGGDGSVVTDQWTPAEANTFLIDAAADFQYTLVFATETSLGANDAARRQNNVQALNQSINSNQVIKSDIYEFNLVLVPGYYECNTAAESLIRNGFKEEAFLIADGPMDKNAEDFTTWAQTYSLHSPHMAIYYPHMLTTNYDGKTIMAPASVMAAEVYAYNDAVSAVWFAPAGTTRGRVTGADSVGYVRGTLGGATEFVYEPLNFTNKREPNS